MDDYAYESFAFWYKKSDDGDKTRSLTAVMNFNLWCQCGWEEHPFLDIGFRLENLDVAEKLYFFLPFEISDEDKLVYIEDLGCKFNKTELVDAVFNESYSTTIAASTKCITVSCNDKNKKDSFKIYQLDIKHDLTLNSFAQGTILNIDTKRIYSSGEEDEKSEGIPVYYLRFRIKNVPLTFLIHEYTHPSGALQGWFNTTYMIDFRYHNIRSLHKTLIEKFSEKENDIVNVKALHFLLMTKAHVDVASGRDKSIRKIEQGVWRDYVDRNDTTDILAYHYVDKPSKESEKQYIESSEIFAKFRVEKSALAVYAMIALGLGTLGSLASAAIIKLVSYILSCI